MSLIWISVAVALVCHTTPVSALLDPAVAEQLQEKAVTAQQANVEVDNEAEVQAQIAAQAEQEAMAEEKRKRKEDALELALQKHPMSDELKNKIALNYQKAEEQKNHVKEMLIKQAQQQQHKREQDQFAQAAQLAKVTEKQQKRDQGQLTKLAQRKQKLLKQQQEQLQKMGVNGQDFSKHQKEQLVKMAQNAQQGWSSQKESKQLVKMAEKAQKGLAFPKMDAEAMASGFPNAEVKEKVLKAQNEIEQKRLAVEKELQHDAEREAVKAMEQDEKREKHLNAHPEEATEVEKEQAQVEKEQANFQKVPMNTADVLAKMLPEPMQQHLPRVGPLPKNKWEQAKEDKMYLEKSRQENQALVKEWKNLKKAEWAAAHENELKLMNETEIIASLKAEKNADRENEAHSLLQTEPLELEKTEGNAPSGMKAAAMAIYWEDWFKVNNGAMPTETDIEMAAKTLGVKEKKAAKAEALAAKTLNEPTEEVAFADAVKTSAMAAYRKHHGLPKKVLLKFSKSKGKGKAKAKAKLVGLANVDADTQAKVFAKEARAKHAHEKSQAKKAKKQADEEVDDFYNAAEFAGMRDPFRVDEEEEPHELSKKEQELAKKQAKEERQLARWEKKHEGEETAEEAMQRQGKEITAKIKDDEQHLVKDWERNQAEHIMKEMRDFKKNSKQQHKKHNAVQEEHKDEFVKRLEATQKAEEAGLIAHGTFDKIRKDIYHNAEKALKSLNHPELVVEASQEASEKKQHHKKDDSQGEELVDVQPEKLSKKELKKQAKEKKARQDELVQFAKEFIETHNVTYKGQNRLPRDMQRKLDSTIDADASPKDLKKVMKQFTEDLKVKAESPRGVEHAAQWLNKASKQIQEYMDVKSKTDGQKKNKKDKALDDDVLFEIVKAQYSDDEKVAAAAREQVEVLTAAAETQSKHHHKLLAQAASPESLMEVMQGPAKKRPNFLRSNLELLADELHKTELDM